MTEIKVGSLSMNHSLLLQNAVKPISSEDSLCNSYYLEVLEALKIESEKADVCVCVLSYSGFSLSEYGVYCLW